MRLGLGALPPEIEAYYTDQVDRLREGSTVSYVSILERRGIEQGIEQGIELGERSVLIRQLTRRFGPLDEPTTTRLQQASAADLERWTENILDAETLDEVFTLH